MPTVSLVMPLYNAAPLLPAVLPPIVEALRRGDLVEAIVVDDGSSDDGVARCRAAGLTVIATGGRLGPAARRNQGAAVARGDLLLFLDSDVVMPADLPARMGAAFAKAPGCVAIFGSYDERPAAPGLVSRYRNLLHHFMHQRGRTEASTFWAGCGAVERAAFLAASGFDAVRYPHPSIEDIELGYRLRRRGGRILLRRDLQVTHHKRWTLASMIHTDIFRRAIPWSRLLLSGEPGGALNLAPFERARAALALLFWATLAGGILRPWLLAPAALLLLLGLVANHRFFLLVARRLGLLAVAPALLLHQLYYLYSVLAYLYCVLERSLPGGRRSPAAGPA